MASKKADYSPDPKLELQTVAAEAAKKKFYAAKARVAEITNAHVELFEELRSRISEYNDALDKYKGALRDVVRANGNKTFIAGNEDEFKVQRRTRTVYNPQPLLDAIPEDQLLEAQAIKKEVVYTIREEEVGQLQVRGFLTQEVVDAAIKKEPDTPSVVCPQYKPLNI